MSHQESQERYEERKKEFLYEINQTGKYHILKEKMKKMPRGGGGNVDTK